MTTATHVLGGEAPPPLPEVQLAVVAGPDAGLRVRVGPAGARVGTGASSHLRLTDPTVSRIHCELELRPRGVRLLDRDSTNGTFLDAVRVRDVELSASARFRLGATVIEVVLGHDTLHVPVSSHDHLGEILGASVEMRRLYAIIERAAPTDATVLVEGETGTGKELVARALHALSPRAAQPFVAVDCGAIAPTLLESELFGHARGAFSGAVAERRGLFEEASSGTLFLDEIGELPFSVQSKLLRVLEGREVRRVGENSVRRVDVRVVAATNRPLAAAVNQGAFREDLYYRLAVIELRLPPLRSRREDIPVLAQHFYERFRARAGAMPAELMSAIATRTWPGNVRELRNFVERSVRLGWDSPAPLGAAPPSRGGLAQDVEALLALEMPLKQAREAWNERFEELYLRGLLARTRGNVTHASELAGVNRRHVQRMLARLGLRDDDDA